MLELLGFLDSLFAGLACASFRYLEPWHWSVARKAAVSVNKQQDTDSRNAAAFLANGNWIGWKLKDVTPATAPFCTQMSALFTRSQLFNLPVFFGDVPTIALLRGTE